MKHFQVSITDSLGRLSVFGTCNSCGTSIYASGDLNVFREALSAHKCSGLLVCSGTIVIEEGV